MEKQLSFTVCFLRMVGNLTTWAENTLHWLPKKCYFLCSHFSKDISPQNIYSSFSCINGSNATTDNLNQKMFCWGLLAEVSYSKEK